MKRYYPDKHTLFETIIIATLLNILFTLIIGIILLIIGSQIYLFYLYILIGLYIIVFSINIRRAFQKISFYFIDNYIVYCNKNDEIKINLDDIRLIEEYLGIEYLFGKKTIIIHNKDKKYPFLFKKEKADRFKAEIERILNNNNDYKSFSL